MPPEGRSGKILKDFRFLGGLVTSNKIIYLNKIILSPLDVENERF